MLILWSFCQKDCFSSYDCWHSCPPYWPGKEKKMLITWIYFRNTNSTIICWTYKINGIFTMCIPYLLVASQSICLAPLCTQLTQFQSLGISSLVSNLQGAAWSQHQSPSEISSLICVPLSSHLQSTSFAKANEVK